MKHYFFSSNANCRQILLLWTSIVLCKTVTLTCLKPLCALQNRPFDPPQCIVQMIYIRAYRVLCNTGICLLIINYCLTFMYIGSRLKKKERKKELFILRISAYISLSFSMTHKYYYFCKLTKQTTRDFGKLASFFISDINIIQFF